MERTPEDRSPPDERPAVAPEQPTAAQQPAASPSVPPRPGPPSSPHPYAAQPYGYGYGTPGYQAPYPQRKTNGFAVASLVLGIVWIYWIGSILALIFGMIAKGQIDRSGGMEQGRGMAIAGIVLGWVGIGFLLLWILFFGLAGCGAALSSG